MIVAYPFPTTFLEIAVLSVCNVVIQNSFASKFSFLRQIASVMDCRSEMKNSQKEETNSEGNGHLFDVLGKQLVYISHIIIQKVKYKRGCMSFDSGTLVTTVSSQGTGSTFWSIHSLVRRGSRWVSQQN